MHVGEIGQGFLCLYHLQYFIRLVIDIPDFLGNCSEYGIWLSAKSTGCNDTHLSGVVASKDRAVIDEGNLDAFTGSLDSSSNSSDATAHYDEIKLTSIDRFFRQAKAFFPKSRKGLALRECNSLADKENSVTAAFKASQIFERQDIVLNLNIDSPCELPVPLLSISQLILQLLPTKSYFEFSRRFFDLPR